MSGSLGYHDIERIALGFVLEDETWPAFLDYCRQVAVSDRARAWLDGGPDLEQLRDQWTAHSPDAGALADVLKGMTE